MAGRRFPFKVNWFTMKFNPNTARLSAIDGCQPTAELAQGLEWVEWLFRSLRQRCEAVVIEEAASKEQLQLRWSILAEMRFPSSLGPAMLEALHLAQVRDVNALGDAEQQWAAMLSLGEKERSLEAGSWLLRCVRGARHAGVLTEVQEAVEEGRLAGHLGIVWPAVAAVFQLPPATLLAEYLRLEFQCAARRLPDVGAQPPAGALTRAVRQTMSGWLADWRSGDEEAEA